MHVTLFSSFLVSGDSGKTMESYNDIHYVVMYSVLMVSRKCMNWLIMFAWLNFGLASNHLPYIYLRIQNCINPMLRELGCERALPLVCADTCISIGRNQCQPDWLVFTISSGCFISCCLAYIMRSGWRSVFSFSRVASVVKQKTKHGPLLMQQRCDLQPLSFHLNAIEGSYFCSTRCAPLAECGQVRSLQWVWWHF